MKLIKSSILFAMLLGVSLPSWSQTSETAKVPVGHITGVGGIFFKAKDPKALAAWYRDVLGLPVAAWGGAVMRYDAPEHPPAIAWSIFPSSTNYFAPSTNDMMINYAVDNMDAMLVRLNDKSVEIIKRSDDDQYGRFAWILDPEGNKIELWEPKPKASK
ncbi:VOC family protein [Undibacterium sp. Ji67W]|uniref:VOC family protein n=1 Tax=Undibacterium sp. Ji67W TaxID=3413042 RepID=UPI003BF0E96F